MCSLARASPHLRPLPRRRGRAVGKGRRQTVRGAVALRQVYGLDAASDPLFGYAGAWNRNACKARPGADRDHALPQAGGRGSLDREWNGSRIVTDGQSVHTLVWHPQSAQVRPSLLPPSHDRNLIPGSRDPLRGFFETARPSPQNRSLGEKSWKMPGTRCRGERSRSGRSQALGHVRSSGNLHWRRQPDPSGGDNLFVEGKPVVPWDRPTGRENRSGSLFGRFRLSAPSEAAV